jgi:predicted enzyme related to lactoylglutathione lyase
VKTMTNLSNRPAWVDLSTTDAAAARDFYERLFGWKVEVDPDPQYGGYGMAQRDNVGIAGIGPKMDPSAPTVWSLYIGTDDVEGLAKRVADAGGTVVMAPFPVGDQGKMAVFQDPTGAFFSTWQASGMRGFVENEPNSFGWGELNARNVEQAIPFYETVFGWTHRTNPAAEGQPAYTEFLKDGESILGAWEMNPSVPAHVPSYWQIYFDVDDVDASFEKAVALGAKPLVPPQTAMGQRFAILNDPQGAGFGIVRSTDSQG